MVLEVKRRTTVNQANVDAAAQLTGGAWNEGGLKVYRDDTNEYVAFVDGGTTAKGTQGSTFNREGNTVKRQVFGKANDTDSRRRQLSSQSKKGLKAAYESLGIVLGENETGPKSKEDYVEALLAREVSVNSTDDATAEE